MGSQPREEIGPPAVAVRRAVAEALAEDVLPMGDLTAALVPPTAIRTVSFVSRQGGVVAGTACLVESFGQTDPALEVIVRATDGSKTAPGTEIARVAGRLASIVTAERTALNFLCHLSGVASLTRRYVEIASGANPSCRVLDTRKTTPGLRALEKAAVRAGGGTNHRGSLSEGVLVKDNHLGGASITDAVRRARELWPGRMIEVECESLHQVAEALAAGATMVLCDNMAPADLRRSVELAHSDSSARVLVEASGGVSLETVAQIASTGVDFVSVGALTHSAPALDIGLDLIDELAAP